jgi:hypothetical protein
MALAAGRSGARGRYFSETNWIFTADTSVGK